VSGFYDDAKDHLVLSTKLHGTLEDILNVFLSRGVEDEHASCLRSCCITETAHVVYDVMKTDLDQTGCLLLS